MESIMNYIGAGIKRERSLNMLYNWVLDNLVVNITDLFALDEDSGLDKPIQLSGEMLRTVNGEDCLKIKSDETGIEKCIILGSSMSKPIFLQDVMQMTIIRHDSMMFMTHPLYFDNDTKCGDHCVLVRRMEDSGDLISLSDFIVSADSNIGKYEFKTLVFTCNQAYVDDINKKLKTGDLVLVHLKFYGQMEDILIAVSSKINMFYLDEYINSHRDRWEFKYTGGNDNVNE